MPKLKPDTIQKLYWTRSEASKLVGVSMTSIVNWVNRLRENKRITRVFHPELLDAAELKYTEQRALALRERKVNRGEISFTFKKRIATEKIYEGLGY